MLTNLNPQNIFIHKDGHVAYIIDLERACSLPTEAWKAPYWLTDQGVDQLVGNGLAAFDDLRKDFMTAFEDEERRLSKYSDRDPIRHTTTMQWGWENGTYFYTHALDCPNGLYLSIFYQHVQPRLARSHLIDKGLGNSFRQILYKYWSMGSDQCVARKINDKQRYD